MDSSFFKVFLYVAKILHNKLSDLISAFYPSVCGLFKATVLSQGLYSVGLCSDCLGLGAVGQLTIALGLNVKTTPDPEPANGEPFTMEARHLSPHPCIACPTNLNVLIN